MKRILSIVACIAIVAATLTSMMAASAESVDYIFEALNYDVHCKAGSYYTGDAKFITNNTTPEEGNPFANQYMCEEANGKYVVVEVTLNSITPVVDAAPEPTDVHICVCAQSDTVEWADIVNGYPHFEGIGDTIRLSTMQLPEDYSVVDDQWWQFVVQVGVDDEAPAKLNAVKGQSKYDCNIDIVSYISDTPVMEGQHISKDQRHLKGNSGASSSSTSTSTSTTGSTTAPTSTASTTTTSGSKTSSNSSTGFGGLVAIPAVAAVFGVVASKKRS